MRVREMLMVLAALVVAPGGTFAQGIPAPPTHYIEKVALGVHLDPAEIMSSMEFNPYCYGWTGAEVAMLLNTSEISNQELQDARDAWAYATYEDPPGEPAAWAAYRAKVEEVAGRYYSLALQYNKYVDPQNPAKMALAQAWWEKWNPGAPFPGATWTTGIPTIISTHIPQPTPTPTDQPEVDPTEFGDCHANGCRYKKWAQYFPVPGSDPTVAVAINVDFRVSKAKWGLCLCEGPGDCRYVTQCNIDCMIIVKLVATPGLDISMLVPKGKKRWPVCYDNAHGNYRRYFAIPVLLDMCGKKEAKAYAIHMGNCHQNLGVAGTIRCSVECDKCSTKECPGD